MLPARYSIFACLLFAGSLSAVAQESPTGQTTLLHPSGSANDYFGQSVVLGQDELLVGVPYDDITFGHNQGSVQLYRRTGRTWAHAGELLASDGLGGGEFGGDRFGSALARDGAHLVVTAEGKGGAGAAYVYQHTQSGWVEQQKLTVAGSSMFGYAASMSGTTLAISDPLATTGGFAGAGAVHVYRRTDAGYVFETTIEPETPAENLTFGRSVVVSDDRIFINEGASNANFVGKVRVHRWTGATWVSDGSIQLPDSNGIDMFGFGLDAAGNTAVVAAIQRPVGGINEAGEAYVFERGEEGWEHKATLQSPDAFTYYFGSSIALGDNFILASASDQAGGNQRDFVYMFQRSESGWAPLAKFLGGRTDGGVSSISTTGTTAAFGISTANVDGRQGQGAVELLRDVNLVFYDGLE
jgi:hypothetical protein